MQDFIKHYLKGHFDTELANPVFDRYGNPTFFQLDYYNTFALLALTGHNVLHLTDSMMRSIILHKTKLIFELAYDLGYDTFRLSALYFKPSTPATIKPPKNPAKKLERPLMDIKSAIQKQPVNLDIANFTSGKLKSCVQIKIIPILS